MSSKIKSTAILVATHDGVFHADEIMAIALLRLAAGSGVTTTVVRSRDAKDWERADFVIDVGRKYDGIKWFDHHQPEGAGRRANGLGYAAFGLIWQHFAITAIRNVLQGRLDNQDLPEPAFAVVQNAMESVVAAVDAHDQAQAIASCKFSADRTVVLDTLTLSQVIGAFNDAPLLKMEDTDGNFDFLLNFAERFLRHTILRKASRTMSEQFISRFDRGEAVLYLPEYCDWKGPISMRPHVMYIVCPSQDGKKHTVLATHKQHSGNGVEGLNHPLPASWAGLTDQELQKVSGVPDALFCHRDRFIATAVSIQGAIDLANLSLTYPK